MIKIRKEKIFKKGKKKGENDSHECTNERDISCHVRDISLWYRKRNSFPWVANVFSGNSLFPRVYATDWIDEYIILMEETTGKKKIRAPRKRRNGRNGWLSSRVSISIVSNSSPSVTRSHPRTSDRIRPRVSSSVKRLLARHSIESRNKFRKKNIDRFSTNVLYFFCTIDEIISISIYWFIDLEIESSLSITIRDKRT